MECIHCFNFEFLEKVHEKEIEIETGQLEQESKVDDTDFSGADNEDR